jgi:hypothetical protein
LIHFNGNSARAAKEVNFIKGHSRLSVHFQIQGDFRASQNMDEIGNHSHSRDPSKSNLHHTGDKPLKFKQIVNTRLMFSLIEAAFNPMPTQRCHRLGLAGRFHKHLPILAK